MTAKKHKLRGFVGNFTRTFLVLVFHVAGLHAQNVGNTPDFTFALGNQSITMASNGDIISITKNKHNSNTTNNDTVVVSFNDVSVDINRDISAWKGNYYPSVFYFPIDKHLLIRDYRNNDIMLSVLDKAVNSKEITQALDTVEIIGACSPIGSEEYNIKLALKRCLALRSYLRSIHPQFAESFPVKFNIIGIDSLGYNILKEQASPLTEKQIWDRLQYAAIRLKMKDGSDIMLGSDKQKTPYVVSPIVEEPVQTMRDTVFLKCDTIYMMTTQYIPVEERSVKNPVYVALKTNLLYDAALLPNLTVEWYIGNQWSLAIEGNWSWWTFGRPKQNSWHHRIQAAGIELRRWFKSPYPLHGHALGIYSMYGDYDVRLFVKDEYTKGDLSYHSWSAGLSYAYSFPIADRFNLELGLAVGYVGGKNYKYDYCMTHEQWVKRSSHNKNYIGPTRLGVSLVWLLGAGNDEKSRSKYAARQKQILEQSYDFQK